MPLPPPPPFLLLLRLCLRVSLYFLPSISLTFSYPGVRPIWFFLTLSRALHLRSVDRSPRGEKRDRGSSSGFLSFPLSFLHLYFAFLLRPLLSALHIADHLDGRLSIHQGPTSPLPIDQLCPRRENSRGVELLPSPDTCLASVPFRRSGELTVLSIFQFLSFSHADIIFLKMPAATKSIFQWSTLIRIIILHSLFH